MASKYMPSDDLDLVVKRSRTGLGLFTQAPIASGLCVIEYKGIELTHEQYMNSRSLYLFEISPKKTIDGAPRWNTARYINHSCRPNCEIVIHRGKALIFSRRRIKAGEELNYDYGEDYVTRLLKGRCLCAKCAPDGDAAKAKPAATKKTAGPR
jgi:SET domain-containing protein